MNKWHKSAIEAYFAEITELKLRVSALEKALLQAEMVGLPPECSKNEAIPPLFDQDYGFEDDIGTSNLTRQVDDMYP